MKAVPRWLGRRLADYLSRPLFNYEPYAPIDATHFLSLLQPADVLLVEGNTRVSSAIKYLTQSTWSHAALYIGDALGQGNDIEHAPTLIEADLARGVVSVPLATYARFNTRICRPILLDPADRERVLRYAINRIGLAYDLKNILDLGRYLLPVPPVPAHLRRRMLALGSGDPTRAICTTLIAQAFQSVRYPILPLVDSLDAETRRCLGYSVEEIHHIRHHSLFAPRDFDLSPFFKIIKPMENSGFDYKRLQWHDQLASVTADSKDPSCALST